MRVKTNDWQGNLREYELWSVLSETKISHGAGAVEAVKEVAESNAEKIGKLIAHLVDTGQIDLEIALKICDVSGEVTIVTQPAPTE